MEKPSKKLYPDYYKVIAEPIDMVTIENNIKNDKYVTTSDLLKDFGVSNPIDQFYDSGSQTDIANLQNCFS